VCDHFGIEGGGEEVLIRQYRLLEQPDVQPDRIYTGEIARLHSIQNQRPPFDAKNPFLAPIKVNRELHKGGGRSCMHIELSIEGSKMRYDAGDHVAMFPVNDKSLVEKLGQLCNADLDTVFSLINTDTDSSKKHPFPCPTTYRTALTHYLEITAIPRTHILKELAEYCTDEKEKELLRSMASISPEGKKLFTRHYCCCTSNRNSHEHILMNVALQERRNTRAGSKTPVATSSTFWRTSNPVAHPSSL